MNTKNTQGTPVSASQVANVVAQCRLKVHDNKDKLTSVTSDYNSAVDVLIDYNTEASKQLINLNNQLKEKNEKIEEIEDWIKRIKKAGKFIANPANKKKK